MLDGFPIDTAPLAKEEKEIAEYLALGFNKRKSGRENAITNKRLIENLAIKGWKVKETRVRKIIHYIRQEHLVQGLCSTSNGYFKAETRKELAETIHSLIQRESAIRVVREALEKDLKEMTPYQLSNVLKVAI